MIRDDLIQIFSAAEEIEGAANVSEMMRRLRDNISRFGFVSCMVTNLPHPKAPLWQEHILINEWPRDWYDRYISVGHYRHDPCVALSRTATGPFVWSDISRAAMNEEACLVMDEAGEFGLRDGICIPVETNALEPAVVTLAGRDLNLAPMARCAVHALARHAYQAAVRLVNCEKEHWQRLSQREREILLWIAEGKTAWEISRILAISENTVNTHMRNMRQKLNTSNTVHTVTEALRRGEIVL